MSYQQVGTDLNKGYWIYYGLFDFNPSLKGRDRRNFPRGCQYPSLQ